MFAQVSIAPIFSDIFYYSLMLAVLHSNRTTHSSNLPDISISPLQLFPLQSVKQSHSFILIVTIHIDLFFVISEVTLLSVLIFGVHSIVHNLILLGITPAYRKFILSVGRICIFRISKSSRIAATSEQQ